MEKEKNNINFKIIIPIVTVVIIAIIGIVVLLNANKTITLTNDNYEQYLKITSSANVNFNTQYKVYLGTNYFTNSNMVSTANEYTSFSMGCSAKGLSNNYIYEDVEITVHFYGTVPLRELKTKGVYNNRTAIIEPTFANTGENVTIDKTITIKCDSSGNVISNSENSYTEKAKEGNYFSSKDVENNIKKDITVKGKVREVK